MGQVGIGGDAAARETYVLRKAIEQFNQQAARQTSQMLWLTRVIVVLTFVMTIGLVVQIYLAVIAN